MWTQFFLENLHFAVNLLAALVFFSIAWLYFDAWVGRKTVRELTRWIGYILLSASFLISATVVESTVLKGSMFSSSWGNLLPAATRIPGYILIIFSLIIDPLQPKPKIENKVGMSAAGFGVTGVSAVVIFSFIYPILAAMIGFLYLRRATLGLERHLKKVAIGFFILGVAEIFSLFALFRDTSNVDLYNFVAPFGPAWVAVIVLIFIAVFMMRGWVFSYLLERIQSQLFMIFTATIVVIFLLTTVSFTFLLLKNLENETLGRLETDVKVLNFAIDSKKAESLSDAQVLAQNSEVISLVEAKTRPKLNEIVRDYLLTKKQSFLVITSETGQVLARGEDGERVGDSLSDDPLVKRSLLGQSASSVITRDGALAPQVFVSSSTPIKKENVIVGVVMTGIIVDNAFVDGIKSATGLEASLYADNTLSATTLLASDGKARAVGIKEENKNIKDTVLIKGKNYTGGQNILNIPYFSAYLPLKDADNIPVGMISAGKPQIGVLAAAGRSIELTFIVTVILLVISVFPALLIARYLAKQLE